MGFIDRHLMPGETLVYRARLHWALLLPSLALTVLSAAALVIVAVQFPGTWYPYVPLGLLALFIVRALGRYLTFHSSEFAITTNRVIVKVGLLTLRSTEILLPKIEAIQIEQDLLGRIFGYGTVLITGTGGTRELFRMMEAPYDFRSQVQGLLMSGPGGVASGKQP